ncbi:SprB repeat-containing protein [Flavobacteriaceae bacterium]|nr:SprB repeat-containing protein [Flavobacteriaceae bacterium]
MKSPQLRCQLTIFCSLLLWTISSYGQILTLPILSSYFGSGPIISICDSETFIISSKCLLNLTLAGSLVFNSDGEIELSCADDTSSEIQVRITGGSGVYTYAWEKDGKAITNNTNIIQNISFDFSVYRRNNRGGYKRLSIDNY